MDIILENAKRFSDLHIRNTDNYEEVLSLTKKAIYDIDNPLDKIKFLNVVIEKNGIEYEKHKPKCTNPASCRFNIAYENINYYLKQELNRLGFHSQGDEFSESDKQVAESKIDQILKELNEIKLGQQILHEDLMKEIEELKSLYFLGKKKWYQLLIGKGVEMTVSGVVSETISKQILPLANKLIDG
ncbi:MAG: hypothetical protein MUC49_19120 [Raineya sp.]|jgi:hypothetical protein|nr:hypothetical protein [Raineya sp.]